MDNWSDEKLFQLSAAGDEAAFNALYDRHQGSVYRFVLAQQRRRSTSGRRNHSGTFLLLIRRPGKFDSRRGSLSAYLLGAARNLLRQHWKRNRIQVEIPDDDAAGSLLSDDDVFGDLTSREALQALHLAILALPLHYREVVVLCHLEGMEYAEAGQVLGCPAGTVCSRLSRARALLVEKLKGHGSCLSTTRMSAI